MVRPTFVTLGGLWCDLKEIKLQGTEKIFCLMVTMELHKTHSLLWIGALWSEGCCMCLSSFMGSVIQDLYLFPWCLVYLYWYLLAETQVYWTGRGGCLVEVGLKA